MEHIDSTDRVDVPLNRTSKNSSCHLQLAEKLTPNELSTFNHLLLDVDFNEREDFEEFCEQVWRLYGPGRAELMLGISCLQR